MLNTGSRQLPRQRFAFGWLFGLGPGRGSRLPLEFFLDARQVFLHQVVQQTALVSIEDLAIAGKPVTPEDCEFVLVLLVLQLNSLDGLILLLDLNE